MTVTKSNKPKRGGKEWLFFEELEDFGLKKNGERLVGTDDQPMIAADTNRGRYRMETNFRFYFD